MSKTSYNKIILALAFPAVLQTIIRSSFSIVDMYWVGKLGSDDLAALTVATFLVWGILSITEMISTGTNSLVAQSVGAEDSPLSSRISTVNLLNTFFYSLFLGIVIIPVLPFLYSLVNLDAHHSALSDEYLVTILVGLPCVALLSTASAIFRGYGDTKSPFYLLVIAVILNVITTPLFIFGTVDLFGFGFTGFGLRGAALGTLVSYLAAFIFGYAWLRRRGYIAPVTTYKFNPLIIKETFRIGLPISLNGVAFSMIYVFVARFVTEYGDVGLAAMGIGHRSESLAYQMSVGFSLAATILVGQNMGAGKPERAEKFAWRILGVSSVIVGIYAIILFVFSSGIASIFTDDTSVIAAASMYNKFAAAVLLFSVADVVLSGAFSGAGDTMPPALIGLPFNILRIPLCAVLSPIYGLDGIWMAISISVLLKGIIILIWFKRGKWKSRRPKLVTPRENITELTGIE